MKNQSVYGARLILALACLGCASMITLTQDAFAQETDISESNSANENDDVVIVMRISRKFLEHTLSNSIHECRPFQTQIKSFPIAGVTCLDANINLGFASGIEGPLSVGITGRHQTSASTTKGRLTADVSALVDFRVYAAIDFEGNKLVAIPPRVQVDSLKTELCDLRTSRVLGSRIVRRIGKKVASKRLPSFDQQARQVMEKKINMIIADALGSAVQRLNNAFSFDDRIRAFIEEGKYKASISSTSTYLQIQIGPTGQSSPKPPTTSLLNDGLAEIWVFPQVVKSVLEAEVEKLKVADGLKLLVRTHLDGLQFRKKFTIQSRMGWDVIEIYPNIPVATK